MQKISNYKFLILIVLFGAILRFSYISIMPPSLNWDEISHGYNAYSILKTGKDEWGQLLPMTNFRAYGDYPLPLNLYLTIPFEIIFGLNQTAIRLPHALLGTLTIISVYFLALGLTKKKEIALIASFLSAIDPWLLFPSRAVFQSNLSVFFLVTAMALFFNREKQKWFLPLSLFSLGMTLFSYHTTRIFSPLLLIAIILIYRKEIINKIIKQKKLIIVSLMLIIIFFGSLPFILLNPSSRARSNVVFIIDQGAINQIENQRSLSNSPFKNLLYNKVTYFTEKFLSNYFTYFSPNFLFLEGGTQYQFSVPNEGLLYIFNLPFFYLGLFIVLVYVIKKRNKDYTLLFMWLLLSPLPAAITQDSSAVIRATSMLPLPELFVAFGLYKSVEKINNHKILIYSAFAIIMLLSLENYMEVYAGSYRTNYSWAWQYGYKEVVDFANNNYNKFDEIITTKAYGEPHEYFLFFLKFDPAKYMNDPNLIRFYQSNWYWVDHFDKFWFVNDWQVKDLVTESKHKIDCTNKKCLIITTPDNAPIGFVKINEVKFLDGKTAFEMYTN